MSTILKSKNLINSFWIMGQQIVQMIVQFAVSIFVIRYLGPEDYGMISYTLCYVSFFISVAALGMDKVVIKRMIEHPDKEGEYLGSCILFRIIASLFSTLLIVGLVYLFNPGENIKIIIVLIQSTQLLFKSVQIIDSWFQRYLISKYSSCAQLIACMVVSGFKVYLLLSAQSLLWFVIADSLMEFIIMIVELLFLNKNLKQKLIAKVTTGFDVLKESYSFIIAGVMVSIYAQIDRIMIGNMLSDFDVGQYSVSANICSMAILIPGAILTSYQPTLLELRKAADSEKYEKLLIKVHSGIIWLCILMSLMVTLLGKYIILFIYGNDYVAAIGSLKIGIWFSTLSLIGSLRSVWLLCEDKTKYLIYFVTIGVIVNIVLNMILIPIMGINGAAIATVVTEVVSSILTSLLFKETRVHVIILCKSFLVRKL